MFAEMLELATASGSRDTLREYTTTIVQETGRLTRLVENVLTFSRLDKRAYTMHECRLAVPELVQSAIDAVQAQLKAGGFTTTVHIESPLPLIRGDGDALHQAVVNVLSNAIKYTGESRDIVVEVRRSVRGVSIAITDHGIGISSEHQARVFEKFYRVSDERTTHVPGAGIGLAIVKQVIEAHRGQVAMASCPGQGSTFTIELPADAA
jgi:signal transduction histidine kinase